MCRYSQRHLLLWGYFLLAVLACHVYIVDAADIDCDSCSSEECADDISIPCCKVCLAHIKCTPKEMVVKLPKTALRRNISLDMLSLADTKCGGVSQGEFYIFRSKMSECGTKSVFIRKTHILYRNELRQRNGKPIYSLTCLFKRNTNNVRKGIRVKTQKAMETRMYHTTVFGRRQHSNSIYLENNDRLFFEIKGPRYLERRKMQMAVKSCQLDITENSNVPGDYHRSEILIKNG